MHRILIVSDEEFLRDVIRLSLADMEADQQGWGLWHQEDAAAETEFDYQNSEVDRLPMRPPKVSR